LSAILAEIDRIQVSQPKLIPPKIVGSINGRGQTAIADRIRSGRYLSIVVGNRRLVFTSSVCDDMREEARASYESDGCTLHKIRQPSSMYRAKPRPRREPSEAELAALRRSNERRRQEGLKRRAEKARKQAQETAIIDV
jgi:hypothetical protein